MHYIAGSWARPLGSGSLEVRNAATEEVMGRVPRGSGADVDVAVAAASAAFEGWSATPMGERLGYLGRITEGVQHRMAEIGAVISAEVGMPLGLSNVVQAGLPLMTFSSMPQLVASFDFEERIGNSLVVREPVGVVACITPWNYPLHQLALKVAPALAAGNTVVAKPSEVAPLSAFVLAEIIDGAGLPPGVFNLITGLGPEVGEALASHPGVGMVSFTGSTAAGRRVAALAAATVKRVALELGGKSPNVILEGAALGRAVTAGVASAFLNSGQTCMALSNMLVPRDLLGEVEELAEAAVAQYAPGDPTQPGTRLGPLASDAGRRRARGYIAGGIAEGARLVAGGPEAPAGLDRGYFVKATVFSEVRPGMTIACEEIFGPVMSILPYDTVDEAVAMANDSVYGLAGAVWAADQDEAMVVARRLRAGMVEVNGGSFNPLAPFGGYKQSGLGREAGRYGLEEFLEVKSIQL